MRNVLITGVSGYVGTILAKRIAREPEVERIIGLDVKEPSFQSPKFTFIKHNVKQPFNHIFIENKIDTALHLAFIVVPVRDEDGAHEINIQGSINFINTCTETKPEQVFYLGSHTEYGAYKNNPPCFMEESPLNPNKDYPYPSDKAAADLMFQEFAEANPDICVTIGRTVAVTGPGGEACGLTTLFLPVMFKAAGRDPLWQFIHEDDMAESIVLLLKNKKRGTFNLAGEGGLTYSQMIEKLGKPSITLPSWLLYGLIKTTWALNLQAKGQAGALHLLEYPIIVNSEKVRRETGYKPQYTGQEAFEIFLKSARR